MIFPLAMPARPVLKVNLALSALFALVFFLVYGISDGITAMHGRRFDVHFGWELGIPFIPAMSLWYLSLNPMFLVTPFVFQDAEAFRALFRILTFETVAAGCFFLVFPVQNAYPPVEATGPFAGAFRIADALNLTYNELPSLHVAFACTLALALGARLGWPGRMAMAAWAVLVVLSTLLIHQHHLVSVLAGITLFAAAFAWHGQPLLARGSATE